MSRHTDRDAPPFQDGCLDDSLTSTAAGNLDAERLGLVTARSLMPGAQKLTPTIPSRTSPCSETSSLRSSRNTPATSPKPAMIDVSGEAQNAALEADQAVISSSDIRWSAMGLLARREHSRRELWKKLKQRFPDADQSPLIDAVLEALAVDNLQSNERFTEAYVTMRKRKGYGPQRILQELKERGITSQMANTHIYDEQHDWSLCAEDAWNRKFRTPARDLKEKARQIRFLQYRGFSQDYYRDLISSD